MDTKNYKLTSNPNQLILSQIGDIKILFTCPNVAKIQHQMWNISFGSKLHFVTNQPIDHSCIFLLATFFLFCELNQKICYQHTITNINAQKQT
jgi:hypothetical protein